MLLDGTPSASPTPTPDSILSFLTHHHNGKPRFRSGVASANGVTEAIIVPESINLLENQVQRWSPASHAWWAIWGLVQARENVEHDNEKLDNRKVEDVAMEYDYLKYAMGRMESFRKECKERGIF